MKLRLLLPMVLSVILSGITILVAGTNPQGDTTQLSSVEAVKLMRLINTAEGEFVLKGQTYVSLDKLLQQRSLMSFRPVIAMADGTSGRIKDHYLVVAASEDGRHYQVTLVPGKSCDTAMFSNESGLVYQGKAMGCSNP